MDTTEHSSCTKVCIKPFLFLEGLRTKRPTGQRVAQHYHEDSVHQNGAPLWRTRNYTTFLKRTSVRISKSQLTCSHMCRSKKKIPWAIGEIPYKTADQRSLPVAQAIQIQCTSVSIVMPATILNSIDYYIKWRGLWETWKQHYLFE